MREHLFKLLVEGSLPEGPRSEDFFSAGPPAATRQPVDAVRRDVLLADIRRRQPQGQHGLAA